MFKTLLFINLKWLLVSMFSGGAKNGKKKSPAKKKITAVLVALLAIYVIAYLMVAVCLLFSSFSSAFGKTELEWFYFALIGLTVFLFTFMGSVFSTQSIIFNAKDNELLLSMPIPTFYILSSRVILLFILDLFYALVLAIPAIGLYFYQYGFSLKMLAVYIICILLTVVFSAAVTSFFGWLLALISSKMRKGTLFQTLFSILFLAAYMLVFANLQNYITLIVSNGTQIADAFRKYLPVFRFFGTAVSGSEILSLAALAVCALIPFALSCLLISKSFIKITTSKKADKKKKYVEKELSVSSAKVALLRKEISRFFSLPMYILNCGTGIIFMLFFSAFILFKGNDMLYAFSYSASMDFESAVPVILCIVFGFCAGMCNSSAVSISLEGSKINVIRSMPIKSDDFFFAKYVSNLIIGSPILMLSVFLSSVGLKIAFADSVSVAVASFAFFALSNFINLFCNTALPRFAWSSEIVVIKQGISVLAAMLTNLATCAILFSPYFIMAERISASIYLWAVSGISLIVCIIFIRYFKTGGKTRFENMNI